MHVYDMICLYLGFLYENLIAQMITAVSYTHLNLVNLVQKIVNEACGLLGMECPEEM